MDIRTDVRAALSHTAAKVRAFAGYAPLPWALDLLLTDACNLHCTYCPIAANMDSRRPPAFVNTADAIAFLDSVAFFRPMIRLIGGEPFLHPDWPEILAAAVRNGLPVTVVTNATRLTGLAEQLVRSGLLAVGISVDPPAAHDTSRGSGTFATCERVVREIQAAKAALHSRTPLIEIYTTVHEGTYASLTSWADELRQWKIDTLRLQHQIWLRTAQRSVSEQMITRAIGHSTFFRADLETYCRDGLPAVDVEVMESQLRELERTPYPFGVEFHPPLPAEEMAAFYRDPDFKRQTARSCTLISTYAFVDPRGRLYPCMTLDLGNVFAEPFESVWNGPRFRAFRRLLRREQRLPVCERCPS